MFESGASHSKLEVRSRTSLLEMLREPDVMFSGPFRGMATDCTSQPHRYYPLLYAGNFRLTTIDERSVCEHNGICPVSICGVVTHLDALPLRPRIHTSAISVDHCLKATVVAKAISQTE